MSQFNSIHRSWHFCIREYQVDVRARLGDPNRLSCAARLESLESGLDYDL